VPKFFAKGSWGLAGGCAAPPASAGAPDRRPASARWCRRRDGTAAAAYDAVVESARLRRQALRPDRRGAGGMTAADPRTLPPFSPSLPLLAGALLLLLALKLAVL